MNHTHTLNKKKTVIKLLSYDSIKPLQETRLIMIIIRLNTRKLGELASSLNDEIQKLLLLARPLVTGLSFLHY